MHTHHMPETDAEIKASRQKSTPDPWYKRYAREFHEGTRELSLEERGAYSDIIDLIYMNGGPIRDDERGIAFKMHVDVRTWRRIRKSLLAVGKLFITRGHLHNAKAKQVLDQREIERRSMGDRSAQPTLVQCDLFGKGSDYNGPARGTPAESERQKEEVEKKDNIIPLRASQKVEGLAGLNGAVAPMLKDIAGWMGGVEEERAREWLGKQIAIYGETVVRNSYSKLSTDIAAGGRRLVARPLQTWCGIAARMHAGSGDETATTSTGYQDQRTRADMEWGKIRRQLAGESE